MKRIIITIVASISLISCQPKVEKSDAYGNFEADKTIISSEVAGRILKLDLHEGDILSKGQVVGQIDSMDLYLKKMQMHAQISASRANFDQIDAQMEVQKQQIENITINRNRVKLLLEQSAATPKQWDEVDGQFQLAQKQLVSIASQKAALEQQISAMSEQLKQIELSLSKCTLYNPVQGSVLNKLSREGELASPGKTLYSLADLSNLNLKAYLSGDQLSKVKIGQKVKVLIDGSDNQIQSLEGQIVWISESAEFTPKTIQTREERVNLVYAFKVRVSNDGRLKIGMPAEIVF
jgi:HlyD family secretion protein